MHDESPRSTEIKQGIQLVDGGEHQIPAPEVGATTNLRKHTTTNKLMQKTDPKDNQARARFRHFIIEHIDLPAGLTADQLAEKAVVRLQGQFLDDQGIPEICAEILGRWINGDKDFPFGARATESPEPTESRSENQDPNEGTRCPHCGKPVIEVFPSILKQLEDIRRRLAPLEAEHFERERQAELEAGYRRVELKRRDG